MAREGVAEVVHTEARLIGRVEVGERGGLAEPAAVEVDVLPAQTEQLAQTHTGIERAREERPVAGQAASKQARDLVVVQAPPLAAVVARPLMPLQPEHRVLADIATSDSVAQNPVQ